mmetsp:Transcript_26972/g.70985  ORF Transcript_26972/g.70985 Transcript_26972/m.70985 type:complete len:450 (+) Transcript_26972:294-1643(+)
MTVDQAAASRSTLLAAGDVPINQIEEPLFSCVDGWLLALGLIIGLCLHRKWPDIVSLVRETLDITLRDRIQAQDRESRKRVIECFERDIASICEIIHCEGNEVGILIASGRDLEIVNMNEMMRKALKWPEDASLFDGSKKFFVEDLLPSNMQVKHRTFMHQASEVGVLPGSLMHPLRNVEILTFDRSKSIRGSLSIGVLSNEIPLSSTDCLFYAVFVGSDEALHLDSASTSRSSSVTNEDFEDMEVTPAGNDAVAICVNNDTNHVNGLPEEIAPTIPPTSPHLIEHVASGQPSTPSHNRAGGMENLWDNVWECTVGDKSDVRAMNRAKSAPSSSQPDNAVKNCAEHADGNNAGDNGVDTLTRPSSTPDRVGQCGADVQIHRSASAGPTEGAEHRPHQAARDTGPAAADVDGVERRVRGRLLPQRGAGHLRRQRGAEHPVGAGAAARGVP